MFSLGTYEHRQVCVLTSDDPVHRFALTPRLDETLGYTGIQRCLDNCSSRQWSVHSQWAPGYHNGQLWMNEEEKNQGKTTVNTGLYEVIIIFGCWGFYLDTGPEFHSKAHWTCTLARESPPVYIPYCRRKWPWLHTQLTFQSCCHLVESQGPHRRWLKWENNIIYSCSILPKCNKKYLYVFVLLCFHSFCFSKTIYFVVFSVSQWK